MHIMEGISKHGWLDSIKQITSTSSISGAADAFDCDPPSVFFAAVDFDVPDFLEAAWKQEKQSPT